MRLSQLKFLVELKKHGSISKTAQKLYISQPSLSTAIKELEEELGFDIIERSNKGVAFTKRGEMVLKYSQDAIAAITNIEMMGKLQEKVKKGYLSVGSVYYVFQSIVMDTFLELKNRYPDMVASLREENSYNMVEMLSNKEIDLGIVMISNLEEMVFQQAFEKYNLQFYKLFEDEFHFVVGKKNPLYGQEAATMQEMLQYPFLTRRKMMNEFNESLFLRYNKDLQFIQIDDSESFFNYLANSEAVTVVPKCTLWNNGRALKGELCTIRVKDFNWTAKLGWIFPKNEQYSVELEEFVGLLKEKHMEINMPL